METKAKQNEEARKGAFWVRVDSLLTDKSKTLKDIAEATEIRYQTIISWRANNRLPDLSSALDIAKFLGVLVETLTEFEEFKKPSISSIVSDTFMSIPESARNLMDISNEDIQELIASGAKFDSILAKVQKVDALFKIEQGRK